MAHQVDTILVGPANGKGKEKEKEKKDLSRQTTLFGLPGKQPNEKKSKSKQTDTTGGKASAGACESQTQGNVTDVNMVEAPPIPPQSETAALVETQAVEQDSLVETQPLDEDDEPIEWPESPQAPLVELDEQ